MYMELAAIMIFSLSRKRGPLNVALIAPELRNILFIISTDYS